MVLLQGLNQSQLAFAFQSLMGSIVFIMHILILSTLAYFDTGEMKQLNLLHKIFFGVPIVMASFAVLLAVGSYLYALIVVSTSPVMLYAEVSRAFSQKDEKEHKQRIRKRENRKRY